MPASLLYKKNKKTMATRTVDWEDHHQNSEKDSVSRLYQDYRKENPILTKTNYYMFHVISPVAMQIMHSLIE
jgi:hypothetical protein